jgi:hypothetical protein
MVFNFGYKSNGHRDGDIKRRNVCRQTLVKESAVAGTVM